MYSDYLVLKRVDSALKQLLNSTGFQSAGNGVGEQNLYFEEVISHAIFEVTQVHGCASVGMVKARCLLSLFH